MTAVIHSGRRSHPVRTSILTAVLVLLGSALVPVAAAAAATPANLVPNPSLERGTSTRATSWLQVASGRNHRVFQRLSGGAAAGRWYLRTTVSQFSSGYAGWSFAPVAVKAGATYSYGDRYRASTGSVVRLRLIGPGSTVRYRVLAPAAAARSWTSTGTTFTLPAGVTRLTVERLLTSNGRLDLDAARLTLRSLPKPAGGTTTTTPTAGATGSGTAAAGTPAAPETPATSTGTTAAGTTGLVSLTFDDGLASQYQNALPVLRTNDIDGTFYLISGDLDASGYMTTAQASTVQADGNELGSHTVTHANLTADTDAQLTAELADSKSALEAKFGTIRTFAYPYGSHDARVEAAAARYYQTARTTDGGINTQGSLKPMALTIRYVLTGTTVADVQGWMQQAEQAGTWTILVYHGVLTGGDEYSVTPANFAAQVAAVKASGVRTATMSQAYDALT